MCRPAILGLGVIGRRRSAWLRGWPLREQISYAGGGGPMPLSVPGQPSLRADSQFARIGLSLERVDIVDHNTTS